MSGAVPAIALVAVMALTVIFGPALDASEKEEKKRFRMWLEKQAEEERKILYENPDDPPHLRRWRKSPRH